MMKHSFFLSATALLLTMVQPLGAIDLPNGRLAPDTLILNDGSELHGLILKNDAKGVILQQRMGEVTIPKSRIRRIMDEGDAEHRHDRITDKFIDEPGILFNRRLHPVEK